MQTSRPVFVLSVKTESHGMKSGPSRGGLAQNVHFRFSVSSVRIGESLIWTIQHMP